MAKYGFFGGLAVFIAFAVLLVNAVPTLFDVLIVAGVAVATFVAGRKSKRYF